MSICRPYWYLYQRNVRRGGYFPLWFASKLTCINEGMDTKEKSISFVAYLHVEFSVVRIFLSSLVLSFKERISR